MSPARLPVLFIGHGSPLNAIEDNRWSRALRELAPSLPRPRAILVVSAHYVDAGSHITAQARPRTIHDFGGFAPALYQVRYPAPGDPALAAQIAALAPERLRALDDWGLDHGSWSVLRHLYPEADVPVLQLSLDSRARPAEHLALAARLRPLREQGVLLLGSGNVTHNLGHALHAWRWGDTATPDWARRFDSAIEAALLSRRPQALIEVLEGADGRQAHPSVEHLLPLLYAAGASDPEDTIDFPVVGFDMGSLSMRSVRFSAPAA